MYYNVTIRRVPETSVAVEEQYYIFLSVYVRVWGRTYTGAGVCLRACRLNYPACNVSP